jgi:hypothetical protein
MCCGCVSAGPDRRGHDEEQMQAVKGGTSERPESDVQPIPGKAERLCTVDRLRPTG